MPSYQATNWWRVGRWGNAINSWMTEWGKETNPVGFSFQQGWYVTVAGKACIIRTPLFFNTTGFTEDIENASLRVYGRGINWGGGIWSPDSICVVSAPDVSAPPLEADYGYLRTRTTLLAPSLYIPGGDYFWHSFIFNDEGKAAINKGGITKLAFRHLTDLSCSNPEWDKAHGFEIPEIEGHLQAWLQINVYGGYGWVEGTNFAYLDASRVKRLTEGTLVGGSGDPGYGWVDGNYWHYIDSSGDERRILGTLTGLVGKIPGQLSVNTKAPMSGTHWCYIDSSGKERSFEGTLA